jgi:tRNA(fMet)-specific endonuclease VapC
MNYLLDTNICIHFFKGQFGLQNKLEQIGYSKFAISEITYAELIYGAEKSNNVIKNKRVVEEFIKKITILPVFNAIELYGKEKARLKTKGTIISDLDLFIGTTAIVYNMILVTRNVSEFKRLENIKIENWIDDI